MTKNKISVMAMLLLISCFWIASPTTSAYEKPSSNTSHDVEIIRDLPYIDTPEADPIKHKLDLYLPPGRKDFPVLVFVHGGGWTHGDKKFWFDIYGKFGLAFAKKGIGVAVINYRLIPKTTHEQQVRDVAKAISWVSRNIGKYGGNSGQLFLAGHSAGGHLVSLIGCNSEWLREAGLETNLIKGIISISGVFDVRPDLLLFNVVFGKSTQDREKASPISHVKPGLPPFLILHGDYELPQCDGTCARQFFHKLEECHVNCKLHSISQRDHMSIIARISENNDPAQQTVLEFIQSHKP